MDKIIAIPAFVACAHCGMALTVDRDLRHCVKAGEVRFHHPMSVYRPCEDDGKEVFVPIERFYIERG